MEERVGLDLEFVYLDVEAVEDVAAANVPAGFGHLAADARKKRRTVVAEEVQPCIVDCFDIEYIEDGYAAAGMGTWSAAVVAAAGVAVAVAVGGVRALDPGAGAVETGSAVPAVVAAVDLVTETVLAGVVLVDLWCCRMERGLMGLDSFYGRKKFSP